MAVRQNVSLLSNPQWLPWYIYLQRYTNFFQNELIFYCKIENDQLFSQAEPVENKEEAAAEVEATTTEAAGEEAPAEAEAEAAEAAPEAESEATPAEEPAAE